MGEGHVVERHWPRLGAGARGQRAAQRARKGKGKRKWDGEDDDGPKKQQKLDREMAEAVEEWDRKMASLSPRSQIAKKLATDLEMAFMEEDLDGMDLN